MASSFTVANCIPEEWTIRRGGGLIPSDVSSADILLWKADPTFRVDMIIFLATLLRFFLRAFRSKRIILSENALLEKENEILLRRVGKQRVHFNIYDKLFFIVLNRAADIKHWLTLVKPETVL